MGRMCAFRLFLQSLFTILMVVTVHSQLNEIIPPIQEVNFFPSSAPTTQMPIVDPSATPTAPPTFFLELQITIPPYQLDFFGLDGFTAELSEKCMNKFWEHVNKDLEKILMIPKKPKDVFAEINLVSFTTRMEASSNDRLSVKINQQAIIQTYGHVEDFFDRPQAVLSSAMGHTIQHYFGKSSHRSLKSLHKDLENLKRIEFVKFTNDEEGLEFGALQNEESSLAKEETSSSGSSNDIENKLMYAGIGALVGAIGFVISLFSYDRIKIGKRVKY